MARRKWRGADLENFSRGDDGAYRYTGPLHRFDTPGRSRAKALSRLWSLSAVMAAAVAVAGCVPAHGMEGSFYVLLPYVASLLSVFLILWLMVRLTAGGDPLRDYVYKATVGKYAARSALAMICAGCAGAGECAYLLLHGFESYGDGVFLACQAALCIGACLWRREFQALRWGE